MKQDTSLSKKLYYPNAYSLIMFEALESVLDKPGLVKLLNDSGLVYYAATGALEKLNNLEKAFDFRDVSAVCATLDELHGANMAHRAGREAVKVGTQHFSGLAFMSKSVYRILPRRAKLRMALTFAARVINRTSDQECTVCQSGDNFTWLIHECPFCFGRSETAPACSIFAGFLAGYVQWVLDGSEVFVQEKSCKALGHDVCEFSIQESAAAF
jgi:predicted hydrocarbon binding protein